MRSVEIHSCRGLPSGRYAFASVGGSRDFRNPLSSPAELAESRLSPIKLVNWLSAWIGGLGEIENVGNSPDVGQ